MSGRIIARGIGFGVAAMALNVVIAFAWVWFYSVAIEPGHDGAFYQAYGQRVAPIWAIVAGIPLLFLAGWLSARGAAAVAALLPAATYIVLDVALMSIGGGWPPFWLLALSYAGTLGSAFAGGLIVRRRTP